MARITRATLKREVPTSSRAKEESRYRLPATSARTRAKRLIKKEEGDTPETRKIKPETPSSLHAKKLTAYAQFAKTSPFPDFQHPTPEECKRIHTILASLHGARTRPAAVVAPTGRAGCGDAPGVLDALVRTILSQNTSETNSTRAKRSMDRVYGRSDRWAAIVAGGPAMLQDAIKCGGLSVVKSKAIMGILDDVYTRYGTYSLDRLHAASSEDAMREMLSFRGVGPKTASCVLLFCLQRESFAVDTHVHRITGLLGWRPAKATRDATHQHLDAMIPDEDKYGLHILLVAHGKECGECRAGGSSTGKCRLRALSRSNADDMIREEL